MRSSPRPRAPSPRSAPPLRPALLLVPAALAVLVAAPDVRPQPDAGPAALDRQILAEARRNPEALANLTHLSDVIGPRLTGSAALRKANDWAAVKMRNYGLEGVRLEAWSMPEGWERGPAHGRVIEPDNGRTLSLASLGWHPGTKGRIRREVVALNARDPKELAALKGKLRGAIVLDGAPQPLPPLDEILKTDGLKEAPALPRKIDRPVEEAMDFLQTQSEFLEREGAAVILRDSGKYFGLLYTTGGWRGQDRASATNRVPVLYVARNHYEMLYRLATRPAPARTVVELEVMNHFVPGPLAVHNTVGEIRGSERPDEFVVVGAHLDSWDLGQGTTDNGAGAVIVLEAARVLARCGTPPKRTIRFVLFTGEEQGLHGARAYVERHKAELPRTSACLVHDTGQGKVIGLGCGSRPALRTLLGTELAVLRELGVSDFTSRSGGGSDHMAFEAKGVPGFLLRQEAGEYMHFTHHSQADTLDRANEANLIQGAQVMAVTAMRIANLDRQLPRERK